jgi:hypothetical protein
LAGIGGQSKRRGRERLAVHLPRPVETFFQLPDPARVDVEPDDPKGARQRHRQRQADIAEADDHDLFSARRVHPSLLWLMVSGDGGAEMRSRGQSQPAALSPG